MNIHLLLVSLTTGVLGIAALSVAGCDKPGPPANRSQVRQFACPMHADIVKGVPGNCPKCGMNLVEKALPNEVTK